MTCHACLNHMRSLIKKNDFYFFSFIYRSNRCTRCLVFIQRHVNLLQYRESMLNSCRKYSTMCFFVDECSDLDDSLNITSCPNMIAPDAALYTLHRSEYYYY